MIHTCIDNYVGIIIKLVPLDNKSEFMYVKMFLKLSMITYSLVQEEKIDNIINLGVHIHKYI